MLMLKYNVKLLLPTKMVVWEALAMHLHLTCGTYGFLSTQPPHPVPYYAHLISEGIEMWRAPYHHQHIHCLTGSERETRGQGMAK